MHDRHTNRLRYFKEQGVTTKEFVIPYLEQAMPINAETEVLEIGCGEGGNLTPFVELGCKRMVGIDLSESKIEKAGIYFEELGIPKKVEFICEDIYEIDPDELGRFDLIIMRDVIEHIHNQEKFMQFVKRFLKPDGKIYLGFPPWYNPFGGHQQMCKSKVLSKIPFFHILPRPIYKLILQAFGESEQKVANLLEIKDTGISIERWEGILRREQYQIDLRTWYFINPNYKTKFGLTPRVAWPVFTMIPFVRNFFTTCSYYLVSAKS